MTGTPCFIVGNSPSLNDHLIYKLEQFFTIGINRAFKKIDTTILLWQDIELYYQERKELTKLKSILFSKDTADPPGLAYHFRLITGNFKLTDNPSILFGSGSSGPLAFQLAYILGCDPIILIGYDCQYKNNMTDFYGNNKDHKPHTLKNCSRGLEWIKDLKIHDRKIISCSKSECFTNIMSIEEAIKYCSIKDSGKGREFYKNKLFST